jgi:hypothetical protein
LAVLNDTIWLKELLDYIGIVPSDLQQNLIEINKK